MTVPQISLAIGWGQTEAGVNDAGTEINHNLLGVRGFLFDQKMTGSGGYTPKTRRCYTPTEVVQVRNSSGGALLPGVVATLKITSMDADPSGTYAIPMLEAVSGAAGTTSLLTVVVDPYLPSAGVPDKGIFLAVVSGPTKARLPAAAAWTNGDITVGNPLIPLASGKIGKYDSTPTEAGATDGAVTLAAALSIMGFALMTMDEATYADALLPCLLTKRF